MPILDVLAAGAAWSLVAASSLLSFSAMWARMAADLVAAAPATVTVFFPLAILLGELLNSLTSLSTLKLEKSTHLGLTCTVHSYIKSSALNNQY